MQNQNFKHNFSDIVLNVENKIDFAKNRGRAPLDVPLLYCFPSHRTYVATLPWEVKMFKSVKR